MRPRDRHRRWRPFHALPGLAALLVLALAGVASGSTADEIALAERYAPIVRLVEQAEECGPGEPYEPIDVEVLFDEPTVALRGPWGGGDLVQIAPSRDALAGGLYEYHLDFPGDALDPGCSYERWARRLTADAAPTVYAHVVADPDHPDRVALQYWLFYAFNDWNNLHEGDWEMIQIIFPAADAAGALSVDPLEVGYSQHEGAERAAWGEEPLDLVDGTHPVVYPAAGSHANFFSDALHLGASGQQGVGCDNTAGPHTELRPAVVTVPSDAGAAVAAFPWLAFEGRWGELQPAFFNGPTGPNLKRQWTHPIAWTDGWRDRSYAVPAGGVLGTSATDFFCSAIASGSRVLQRGIDNPMPALAVLAGLLLLLAYLISRATWRPGTPVHAARRRAWGQILTAAARSYRRRPSVYVGIGLIFIPISLAITALQAGVFALLNATSAQDESTIASLAVFVMLAVGTTLTLLGLGLVQAATLQALLADDAGRRIGLVEACRLAAARLGTLVRALLVAVLVVSLLAASIFALPFAVWLAVRWALVVPVIELERVSALGALRRSRELVRGRWLKVGSLIVVGAGLALLAGPLLAGVLIILTDTPLSLLNLLAALVYALTMPFVALVTAFVYLDARVRHELAPPAVPTLPAEIDLAAAGRTTA